MNALTTQEPAVAAAMARCLAARWRDPKTALTDRHPGPCGWCPYPLEELKKAVDEFHAWSDFARKHDLSGRYVVRRFNDLPRAEQNALIVEAQALEADEKTSSTLELEHTARPAANPEPEPEPSPAVADGEIAWLR